MAVELVVELLALLGQISVAAVMGGPVRQWRLNAFYKELSAERKTAFLEIMSAAMLYDGEVSASEETWLARRRAASESDVELVDGAMGAAKVALPSGSDDSVYTAFVSARADLFESDKQREKVYAAAHIVLRACAARPDAYTLFSGALGVLPSVVARLDASLMSGGA